MAENFFGQTDIGKVRTNNEDTFIAEKTTDGKYVIACAIDGVGGYSGGEVAAALARESILEHINNGNGTIEQIMHEALEIANERIYQQKLENREHESMACVLTLVIADLVNNEFHYIHVGDTRLYLFRDRSLVKLTKDQSFVGFLEDSGRLTEADAMAHPKRNEINKALGFSANLDADYFESGRSPFLPGDLLLLCSDGLTDMIDRETIINTLDKGRDLSGKAKDLIRGANDKGGKDNITAVLVQNNNKALEQEAMMPASFEKKKVPDAEVYTTTNDTTASSGNQATEPSGKRGKGVFLLSLLSIALLACCIYLLWELGRRAKVERAEDPIVADTLIESEGQRRLLTLLQEAKGDTLILSDSIFAEPLLISDSIVIRRDSLFILARGKIVLKRDSAYTGAAVVVPANITKLTLSGLTFEGFETAISTASNGLTMQGVNIVNGGHSIKYLLPVGANSFLNGTLDEILIRKDTTLKPSRN